MLEAKCPSCGAPVTLKAASSVAAVCSYCGTTVTRADGAGRAILEDHGKISALVEDASPLCLGAEGEVFGKRFQIVGRLQLEHDTGYWNEWHLLYYAREETGWLGEAAGQYFVTTESSPGRGVPRFEQLRPGQTLQLAGAQWTVAEARVGRAKGGEGELPFLVGDGYELPYADLRGPDRSFASIDYSEDQPRVFVGKCVGWDDLKMTGHRRFHGW